MSMKGICKTLSNIMLVIGIIGSFSTAYLWGNLGLGRNWIVTLIIFCSSLLSVFILCVILYAIDEVLENQERLYKKLSEELSKSKQTESSSLLKNMDSNAWQCPKCGKSNAGYTGTCGCGTVKP